jgi:phosphoglycolate phosphatase-like HAD superfamily hydrolase
MKLFVWDLHGVLETGNEKAVLAVSNAVLEEAGFRDRFTVDDINRMYGLKWHEYFEALLPNLDPEVHKWLAEYCLAYSAAHRELITENIRPTDFSHEVLEAIAGSEHYQCLISNSEPDGLKFFMDSIDIAKYFRGMSFAANVHNGDTALTKQDMLEDLLDLFYYGGIEFGRVVVIGDSPGDMALRDVSAGSKAYLYAHPGRPFRDKGVTGPVTKIRDLREVRREI